LAHHGTNALCLGDCIVARVVVVDVNGGSGQVASKVLYDSGNGVTLIVAGEDDGNRGRASELELAFKITEDFWFGRFVASPDPHGPQDAEFLPIQQFPKLEAELAIDPRRRTMKLLQFGSMFVESICCTPVGTSPRGTGAPATVIQSSKRKALERAVRNNQVLMQLWFAWRGRET
jgi:hypothetical protein